MKYIIILMMLVLGVISTQNTTRTIFDNTEWIEGTRLDEKHQKTSQNTVCNAQNTTVTLIDNTELIEDAGLLKKRQQVFQNTVWKAMKQNGDRVIISYVYENSGNRLNQREYILRIPLLRTEHLTPQKAKIAKLKHKKLIKKLRKEMVLKITNECLSYNMYRPQTHILGIFPLMQEWKNKYGNYSLVILSDMIEFSSYRNHYKTYPKNNKTARELGEKDAHRIRKDFSLRDDFLKGISIVVRIPIHDMDSRKIFVWLPDYWQGAFSIFGSDESTLDIKRL